MKNNAKEVFNYKTGRHRTIYPKATELAVNRIFGKINPNKVYSVEPDILKIAIFLWKSKLLTQGEEDNFANFLDNQGNEGRKMLAKIRKFSNYEIPALTLSPVDHNINKVQTTEIRKYKQTIREAALIHYNMDLAALQCYAGGRWTGEQRRTECHSLIGFTPKSRL